MQIVGIWPYSVRQMSRARLTLEEFRDVGDGGDGRRDEEMASGELAIRFLPSSLTTLFHSSLSARWNQKEGHVVARARSSG